MKMRFWLTPGLLALSDFDSSTRMLLLWKAACCAQVSKSHLSIDHLSGAINYLLLNKIWQWEDILYVFCVFFFCLFLPSDCWTERGPHPFRPIFSQHEFLNVSCPKMGQPRPPRPPPVRPVRLPALMCEWSCWSTVGSGGQAEGGGGQEQWPVLLCAGVGGGRESCRWQSERG